jgi:hypothetical protein
MIREAQLVRNQGVEGKEPWRLFQPDRWRGFQKRGTQYDFHAVSGDQGLLWSWVRHYQRRFSYVVKGGMVENYVPSDGDNTSVRLDSVIANPFAPDHLEVWPVETSVWGTKSDFERRRRSRPPPKPGAILKPHKQHLGAFGSFFHFFEASGGKPWHGIGCSLSWDATTMPATERGLPHADRAQRFWCQTYHEVTLQHNVPIPASTLSGISKYDATYHSSIGSDMWATPGPVTDLLEPDFDPLLPRRKTNV